MPQDTKNQNDSINQMNDENLKLLIEKKSEICQDLVDVINSLHEKSDYTKSKMEAIPDYNEKISQNGIKNIEVNEILKYDIFSSETSYSFKQMKSIIIFVFIFVLILAFCTVGFYLKKSDLNAQSQNIYNKTENVAQIDSIYSQNFPTASKDTTEKWNKKHIINSFLTQSNNKQCLNNELWLNIFTITLLFGSIIVVLILLFKRFKDIQDHLLENRNKDNELNRKLLYENTKFREGFLKSKLQNETIQFELFQKSKNEQINEVIRHNDHFRKLDFKFFELENEKLKKSYDFGTILKDFLK